MNAWWIVLPAAAAVFLALGKYRLSGVLVFSGGSVAGRIRIRPWWNFLVAEWESGGGGCVSVYLAKQKMFSRRVGGKARKSPSEKSSGNAPKRRTVRSAARAAAVLKKIAGHIRIRKASCRLVFGTGNPCSTGVAWGWFCALRGVFPRQAALSVKPDFLRKRFEGNVQVGVEFTLAVLVAQAVACAVRTAFNE